MFFRLSYRLRLQLSPYRIGEKVSSINNILRQPYECETTDQYWHEKINTGHSDVATSQCKCCTVLCDSVRMQDFNSQPNIYVNYLE